MKTKIMLQSIFPLDSFCVQSLLPPPSPYKTTVRMISPVHDLLRLAKTNIRSATECNSFLCCHAQSQQWLDILKKTKEI